VELSSLVERVECIVGKLIVVVVVVVVVGLHHLLGEYGYNLLRVGFAGSCHHELVDLDRSK